jgi:hypothetical protein
MRVRIVFEVDVSRRSEGDKLARDLMQYLPQLVYAATEICDEDEGWHNRSWMKEKVLRSKRA